MRVCLSVGTYDDMYQKQDNTSDARWSLSSDCIVRLAKYPTNGFITFSVYQMFTTPLSRMNVSKARTDRSVLPNSAPLFVVLTYHVIRLVEVECSVRAFGLLISNPFSAGNANKFLKALYHRRFSVAAPVVAQFLPYFESRLNNDILVSICKQDKNSQSNFTSVNKLILASRSKPLPIRKDYSSVAVSKRV